MNDILVVEDDQTLLKGMLQTIGNISPAYNLFSAENGIQALEVLKKHSICILVTDLRMPEMDGFELLMQVIKNYPDIPVVITTGHRISKEQEAAFEQGAFDLLFKPFPMKKLREAVKRGIDKQNDGGILNKVSPEMFLQLVHMERKTCTVRIHQNQEGRLGVLFFRRGQLLDARMNDLRGKAATLEIFSWDDCTLSIENDCPVHDLKISQTLTGLLLEAARLKDERIDSISTYDDAVPDCPPEGVPSDSGREDQDPSNTLKARLEQSPQMDGVLERIDNDTRWNSLLDHMHRIGQLLTAGSLKAIGMTTQAGDDYVVFPTRPSTALKIDPNCPKERFYTLVE